MSYPRNAASPPPIAIGAIYLTADGTAQTTDALVRVKTGTGSWGSGAGTLACDTTSGVWVYTPTQGETNAESFLVAVYKAASTTAQITVVTSASTTAGYGGLDWGKILDKTATVALTNTTIGLTTAGANAARDAVWNALPATGYTNESFGDRILISDSSQRTVKVTGGGSGHIAADIHAAQAGVLTETVFGDGAISARVVAADAVTEIQGVIPDRLGYTLAILAGACSDAGTSGETYAITLDTVTYTVDYTGLTSVGNRGTTALSKSP